MAYMMIPRCTWKVRSADRLLFDWFNNSVWSYLFNALFILNETKCIPYLICDLARYVSCFCCFVLNSLGGLVILGIGLFKYCSKKNTTAHKSYQVSYWFELDWLVSLPVVQRADQSEPRIQHKLDTVEYKLNLVDDNKVIKTNKELSKRFERTTPHH